MKPIASPTKLAPLSQAELISIDLPVFFDVKHPGATFDGGSGSDIYVGKDYDKAIVYGDGGNDILIGGGGADQLHGGAGNDTLVATGTTLWTVAPGRMVAGTAILDGGSGDDTLVFDRTNGTFSASGGSGNDHFIFDGWGTFTATGGTGADVFTFDDSHWGNSRDFYWGDTTITDFEIGTDHLEAQYPWLVGERNGNAVIEIGRTPDGTGPATLELAGISAATAQAHWQDLFL